MPAAVTEQKLFDALATITLAFAEGAAPPVPAVGGEPPLDAADAAIAAMDPESRDALGEAALAVSFGAFASRGGEDGAMHMLVAAMGLMAMAAGEEPDPPAEIMAVLAEDGRVESEIDRAGEAVDHEFGRDAAPERLAAALEARILGSAITLAGCTLPEHGAGEGAVAAGEPRNAGGQAAVRLRAARYLARLAAGLVTMNAAGGTEMTS